MFYPAPTPTHPLQNQALYDDSDCDSAELDHSGSAEPSRPPSNWEEPQAQEELKRAQEEQDVEEVGPEP